MIPRIRFERSGFAENADSIAALTDFCEVRIGNDMLGWGCKGVVKAVESLVRRFFGNGSARGPRRSRVQLLAFYWQGLGGLGINGGYLRDRIWLLFDLEVNGTIYFINEAMNCYGMISMS